MKRPRPIKVRGPKNITIEFAHRQYLYVDVLSYPYDVYGYIQDRDVKRLHKWCEAILTQKQKKKK